MQVRQKRGININPATLPVRSVNMTAMTSLAAQHQVGLLIQFSDEILHTFEKILEIGFHLGFLTNSHFLSLCISIHVTAAIGFVVI